MVCDVNYSTSWIAGKTCIITGANTGIGKETAKKLAELEAHVIMICRNSEKGQLAREEIVKHTGNTNVDLLICDLSSLTDVSKLAKEIQQKYSHLHVLINNAGVFKMERIESKDGFEESFAVNYLSHFLLTKRLLPMMIKNAPARIINLSSDIHRFYKIKMKDPLLEKRYNGQQAYSNSKTAMVLFTYKLAREVENEGIMVNAVHPGHVRTQMTTKGLPKWFLKIKEKIVKQRTPEEGAQTTVYVASADEVSTITSKYFSDCTIKESGRMTYNINKQEELWELSAKLIKEALN